MRTTAALLLASLAVALTGCGADQQADFRNDYRSLDGDVQRLGLQVGDAITGAGTKANNALAVRFGELSSQTRDLANKVDDTDPPNDLKPARDRLSKALRAAARDLQALSTAATNGDGTAARETTIRIVHDGEEVEAARVALSKAAGR